MALVTITVDEGLLAHVKELLETKGEGANFHINQIVCAICLEENCYLAQADCVDDVENCECCRCWEELSEREQVSNNG
jgi:hypothetical protein